jgi:hypothetical protein
MRLVALERFYERWRVDGEWRSMLRGISKDLKNVLSIAAVSLTGTRQVKGLKLVQARELHGTLVRHARTR